MFFNCKQAKVLGTVITATLLLSSGSASAERDIRILADGDYINFPQAPDIEEGSTLVPFRAVFERFDCTVNWNDADRSVLAEKDGVSIQLKIDDEIATVNGQQTTLSVAPKIIGDSTMVPLRFISEALGYGVYWDGLGSEVIIRTDGVIDSGRNYPEGLTGKKAYVYFNSQGNLYRVINDGSKEPELLLNAYDSRKMVPADDYIFFYAYGVNSHTLLRLPTDGSVKMGARFIDDDVMDFQVYQGFLYYLNAKGFIYRIPVDEKTSETMANRVELASMVTSPGFYLLDNRIYFNTLKDGRYPYVASKDIDGNSENTWFAPGNYIANFYINYDRHNIHVLVNTNPEETEYSTDCVVIYSASRNGGEASPVNGDDPIDFNSATNGEWADRVFEYNYNVTHEPGYYSNYDSAYGEAFDIYGYKYEMPNNGVREMVAFDRNRVIFVDGNADVYVANIGSGNLTNIIKLDINEVYYVRNLVNDGYIRATMLFGMNGTYIVKNDLSIEQLNGVEWDTCMYSADVDGIFYINAADNGRLYWINNDGSDRVKLTDLTITDVSLINPIND